MATSYPGALDVLLNPTGTTPLGATGLKHSDQHINANDAIEAIQATLGTNPHGAAATVGARIGALETGKSDTSHTHAAATLPNAHIWRSAHQEIGPTAATQVVFDTVRIDTNSFFNSASGYFVIPAGLGGTYMIGGGLYWKGESTAGMRQMTLTVHRGLGWEDIAGDRDMGSEGAAHVYQSVVSTYSLSAGDFVRLTGYHDASSTWIDINHQFTYLWITKIA